MKPKSFINGSLLRLLVLTAYPDLPETFTILELSLVIKQLILAVSWYDPNNPHMIIWPEKYQQVFKRTISDAGDLHVLLLPHLVDDTDPMAQFIDVMPETQKFVVKVMGKKPSWRSTPAPIDSQAKYVVAPGLRSILSLDKDHPTFCLVFSYQSVLIRVLRYINANRHWLIDPREPNIIDVRNDPLGKAFGVQAFTRVQMGKFILWCLAKVNDEEAWATPSPELH
jgi:hypothetical protein